MTASYLAVEMLGRTSMALHSAINGWTATYGSNTGGLRCMTYSTSWGSSSGIWGNTGLRVITDDIVAVTWLGNSYYIASANGGGFAFNRVDHADVLQLVIEERKPPTWQKFHEMYDEASDE